MLTVGSFGFILFAALLAGLWRVTPAATPAGS